MTAEIPASDPYEAVLADLRTQRDKIEQAITILTALRSSASAGDSPPAPPVALPSNTPGMYLGMSIADAAKKLLSIRKQTMGNAAICKELQAGGLVLTGADPVNVIGSVLTRRFNQVGDIVKVGRGIWGLKEWYPGRNFKTASKAASLIAEAAYRPSEDEDSPMEPNATFDNLVGTAPSVEGEDF